MIGFYFCTILEMGKNKTQRFKRFPEELELPILSPLIYIVNNPTFEVLAEIA